MHLMSQDANWCWLNFECSNFPMIQCTMGFHITFKEMEHFFFKLILWLQFSSKIVDNFHRKLLKPFLHDRQLPKDYAKYFLIKYDQYLQRYSQKNMKGSSSNSEILCVNQIDRDLKKREKTTILDEDPFKVQIFSKYFLS